MEEIRKNMIMPTAPYIMIFRQDPPDLEKNYNNMIIHTRPSSSFPHILFQTCCLSLSKNRYMVVMDYFILDNYLKWGKESVVK
jgi:hypothetical protein